MSYMISCVANKSTQIGLVLGLDLPPQQGCSKYLSKSRAAERDWALHRLTPWFNFLFLLREAGNAQTLA
jgi:hypothetical protein